MYRRWRQIILEFYIVGKIGNIFGEIQHSLLPKAFWLSRFYLLDLILHVHTLIHVPYIVFFCFIYFSSRSRNGDSTMTKCLLFCHELFIQSTEFWITVGTVVTWFRLFSVQVMIVPCGTTWQFGYKFLWSMEVNHITHDSFFFIFELIDL